VPLYEQFTSDDWELVMLRFSYGMLLTHFKKDADDPDRTGIPQEHLPFYYQKYFHKPFNLKPYGLAEISELFVLIKDVVAIKEGIVTSQLSDEIDSLDIFVKLSEEHRRERQRRIDAGDETARLKFEKKPQPHVPGSVPSKAGKEETPAAKAAGLQKMTPAPKKETKGSEK
jgi:hypothetical protein